MYRYKWSIFAPGVGVSFFYCGECALKRRTRRACRHLSSAFVSRCGNRVIDLQPWPPVWNVTCHRYTELAHPKNISPTFVQPHWLHNATTFIVQWSAIFDACCPVNQILVRVRHFCPFHYRLFVPCTVKRSSTDSPTFKRRRVVQQRRFTSFPCPIDR